MKILSVAVGVVATTLGQSLLLSLLFTQFMTAYTPYVTFGLLLLNSGLAMLAVRVDSSY